MRVKLEFSDIWHLTHDQAIIYSQFTIRQGDGWVSQMLPKLLHLPPIAIQEDWVPEVAELIFHDLLFKDR